MIPKVVAKRAGGRVATVLNQKATAADPWFFTADDGTTYIVKQAVGDRCAFNEAFFGRLAKRMGLPVPDVVAIEIPQELVDDDPELSGVQYPAGVHVGISRLPNGTIDLRGGALVYLGSNLVIDNASSLPGTAVFSSWVDDDDHYSNDGNWMLQHLEGNRYVAWMIDFGHSLTGPDWEGPEIDARANPASVKCWPLHSMILPACVPAPACYTAALAMVDSLTDEELNDLLASVPAAWSPPPVDRARVVPFLRAREPGLKSLFAAPQATTP